MSKDKPKIWSLNVITIEKLLPGELEGNIDPGDYGFEVIKEDPPSDEELRLRAALFYRRAKQRTGVVIPSLEPYLTTVAEARDDERGDR